MVSHSRATASSSQIFRPFRSLGIVTNEVPFHLQRASVESYVTLSTGKSYQVLNVSFGTNGVVLAFVVKRVICGNCFDKPHCAHLNLVAVGK